MANAQPSQLIVLKAVAAAVALTLPRPLAEQVQDAPPVKHSPQPQNHKPQPFKRRAPGNQVTPGVTEPRNPVMLAAIEPIALTPAVIPPPPLPRLVVARDSSGEPFNLRLSLADESYRLMTKNDGVDYFSNFQFQRLSRLPSLDDDFATRVRVDVGLARNTMLTLHMGASEDRFTVPTGPGAQMHPSYNARYTAELRQSNVAGASGLNATVAMSATTSGLGANMLASVSKDTRLRDWNLTATALVLNHNGTDTLVHGGMTAQRDKFNAGIYYDSQRGLNGVASAVSASVGYDIIKTEHTHLRVDGDYVDNLGSPGRPEKEYQVMLRFKKAL